jgi:GntR family transcriptional regulator/MocR family aminotransferase
MLSVALQRDDAIPLVRQLHDHLRELILTGRLSAGSRLPSTRKLSRDLQVSRTVTLDAFGQLAAEGFLETRRGSGHFVAQLQLPRSDQGPAAAASEAIDDAGPSIWSRDGSPFDPSWQAVDLFPAQAWTRMLGRGSRRHRTQLLQRHWGGLPALREALAEHLHALRGIALGADEVMITSGNADALTLIARALGRDGQAWVEDPGLGTARQTFQREGMTIVAVPIDAEGMQVAAGERRAPDAALALVTPTRQFPLGMPLSLPRRLALLDWSRRSGAVLIDDDYDGEIRFAGRPLRSLASLDPTARVLTLGSFSKLTFPGMRLGYIAGPADLIARLVECRRETYALMPATGQAALAEFILTGGFARHLRALRSALTRRRKLLVDALGRDADELVEILPQEVGMHLSVRLRSAIDRSSDVELSARAREAGLVLLPLSQQYVEAEPETGFLLGYAGWADSQMLPAIARLIELLRAARG